MKPTAEDQCIAAVIALRLANSVWPRTMTATTAADRIQAQNRWADQRDTMRMQYLIHDALTPDNMRRLGVISKHRVRAFI